MNKIQMVKSVITNVSGRTGLILRKNSPEILLTTGIIGVVASTVMACKATTKAEEVLDRTKDKLETIHTAHATIEASEYSEKDYKKDLLIVYTQTGVEFLKTYGPAITLGVASIGCILGAHNIMKRRNVALIAAYKAIEESFSKYRSRVVEQYGKDKDFEFKTGIRKEKITVEEVNEKGKTVKSEKTINVMDPNSISEYARYFDESCTQWSPIPDYNLMFLTAQQNHANDLLQARGHVFLNEVYDALGIPRTKAGSLVGWVKEKGDGFVDFGMHNIQINEYENDMVNETIGEKRRDFVNGYRSSILLDFNVDGIIWDLI